MEVWHGRGLEETGHNVVDKETGSSRKTDMLDSVAVVVVVLRPHGRGETYIKSRCVRRYVVFSCQHDCQQALRAYS